MDNSILKESLRSLARAAKQLPNLRGSKPPHPNTLLRWATSGLRSRGGRYVRLETVKVGGTRCTSTEALERFFERLDDVDTNRLDPTPSDQQMKKQADQAIAVLRQRGVIKDDD